MGELAASLSAHRHFFQPPNLGRGHCERAQGFAENRQRVRTVRFADRVLARVYAGHLLRNTAMRSDTEPDVARLFARAVPLSGLESDLLG